MGNGEKMVDDFGMKYLEHPARFQGTFVGLCSTRGGKSDSTKFTSPCVPLRVGGVVEKAPKRLFYNLTNA